MTRPVKDCQERLMFSVHVRMNENQKDYAEKMAHYSGLTIPEWFRACAFNARKPLPQKKILNRQLYIELNKVGTNINQLTHQANLGKSNLVHIRSELQELHQLLSLIQQKLLE